MRAFYVAVDKQVGGRASAGAVKAGPAAAALLPGIDVQGGKTAGELLVKASVIYAAQLIVLVAHELVAGVDVPVGRDGHILAPGAAAPQPLDDAGALGQVHVEVEEVGLRVALQVLCQALILGLQG